MILPIGLLGVALFQTLVSVDHTSDGTIPQMVAGFYNSRVDSVGLERRVRNTEIKIVGASVDLDLSDPVGIARIGLSF